jgi:hypothetical protein
MAPENAHAFVSLEDASDFLRRELREGDLVLLKGRASDHVSRLAFAQFGEIGCWVEGCAKNVECDDCEELRPQVGRAILPAAAFPGGFSKPELAAPQCTLDR